jgi:methylglyoxal synthase
MKAKTRPSSNRAVDKRKTWIGVLASRDDRRVNRTLISIFDHIYNRADRQRLEAFHLVFTQGTYERVFFGDKLLGIRALDPAVSRWLHESCGVTVLPPASAGGVVLLSYLLTQRQCSIVWPFFGPQETHWLRPENLAFMRLSDQWHVKRLMNRGSVLVWFDQEAVDDADRNLQKIPVEVICRPGETTEHSHRFILPKNMDRNDDGEAPKGWLAKTKTFKSMSIALIAHDEMKSRMIEFAVDHEAELEQFGTILATGTTGREVAAATSKRIDQKMVRYHSGPKGGDVEIATEILYGHCNVVVFFIDPLRPHPHVEDIRVVFEACMLNDNVVMITNEMHARSFMSRVVRGKQSLTMYLSDEARLT